MTGVREVLGRKQHREPLVAEVCPGSSEPQKTVHFLKDVVIISQVILLY